MLSLKEYVCEFGLYLANDILSNQLYLYSFCKNTWPKGGINPYLVILLKSFFSLHVFNFYYYC